MRCEWVNVHARAGLHAPAPARPLAVVDIRTSRGFKAKLCQGTLVLL